MRVIAILIILTFSSLSFSNTKNWNQIYQSIQNDINLINKTKKKDTALLIRLFELMGEKYFLLQEKENEYKLLVLESDKYDKKLKNISNQKLQTLKELHRLSKILINRVKQPNILARIHYSLGLHFLNSKKPKMFEYHFLKASKLAKTEILTKDINTRLAEHFFNEKQYKKALYYYQKILGDSKDPWYVKHLFNSAWCYLKLNKNKVALETILKSYEVYKRKPTISLGNQHLDSILLFYTFNSQSMEAVKFLEDNKQKNFTNLMQLLHYTFENGDKKETSLVIDEIEKLKLSSEEYTTLLTKKILVYRTLKNYQGIRQTVTTAKDLYLKKKLSLKKLDEFITQVEGFTGFLQEKIKHPNFLRSKNKAAYLNLIDVNFVTLATLNPKKRYIYFWMRGETYLSIKDYEKALNRYQVAIDLVLKNKNQVSLEETSKIFTSYFATIKEMEKREGKSRAKALIYGYKSYLEVFPRSKLSADIYIRYFNVLQQSQSYGQSIEVLKKYHQNYPQAIRSQQGYFKK
jgi:tetratricopeptide (TPR) repeat protein